LELKVRKLKSQLSTPYRIEVLEVDIALTSLVDSVSQAKCITFYGCVAKCWPSFGMLSGAHKSLVSNCVALDAADRASET